MRVSILAVGRLSPGAERDLYDRYAERIGQIAGPLGFRFDAREISQSKKSRPADRIAEEARLLHTAIPSGATLVALDERGRSVPSAAFAERLAGWRDGGTGELAFLIGGADGLSRALVDKAALVLAFGSMSWPHLLARAMLAEQLYRAMTIIAGRPYHRP